jgi:hypothetical protein
MSNFVRYSKSTVGRELTPGLWSKKLEAWANDPSVGQFRFEDFNEYRANTTDASGVKGWFLQDAAAGGTNENFTSIEGVDGIVTLSATTGTDHFGIEVHYGETSTSLGIIELPTSTTDARGDVVFEVRLDLNETDTWFVGLTEPLVDFLGATAALPATSDYIGFFASDDGALRLVSANDNNGGTAVTFDVTLLTAAQRIALQALGYIKLGFCVRRDGGLDIYVNGTPYTKVAAATVVSTAFPEEVLTYKIGLYRGPTGDDATVSANIDWVASFVEAL